MLIGCAGSTSLVAGIPVVDGTHIGTQAAEFLKELQRYETMLEEWKSKLAINPLDRPDNSLPKIGAQLKVRDEDEGVEQRCNRYGEGGALGGLGDLFGISISFNPDGNLREEQKKLCNLQVRLENRRWNENVLLIKAMELQQEQVDAAAKQRASGDTEGEANTKATDITISHADFETIKTTGIERIKVLDSMIDSTKQLQTMAAEQLLSGQKPSGFAEAALNDLVQGAVLCAALSVGNDSEEGPLQRQDISPCS
jgi:hypothetical protein